MGSGELVCDHRSTNTQLFCPVSSIIILSGILYYIAFDSRLPVADNRLPIAVMPIAVMS